MTTIQHSSPWISQEDISFVLKVMNEGMVAKGEGVLAFTAQCKQYLEHRYAWAVGSGKEALFLALSSLDIKENQEVILPTYTCKDVEEIVVRLGAVPVYCDVGEDWGINHKTLRRVLSQKTAAIIVVHPFGVMIDVDPLLSFGIPVIEDCCQCFSPLVGKKGICAIYSFHATKCLTTGEGGLITTQEERVAENIEKSISKFSFLGGISDLQAALGLSQIQRYDVMLNKRKAMAESLRQALPTKLLSRIQSVWDRSIFFRFPLTIEKDIKEVTQLFLKEGIHVRRGVDVLLHRKAKISDSNFPGALNAFKSTLSIPFYPALKNEQTKIITEVAGRLLN